MDQNQEIENNAPVKSPEKWRLALRLDSTKLCYTLHTPEMSDSMKSGSVIFDKSAESALKGIENAFYDNSILLDDYSKVQVIVDNDNFVLVPEDLADEDNAEKIFGQLYPDFEGDVLVSDVASCGCKVIYGAEKGMKGFLERTYANVEINHCMVPMLNFFHRRSMLGNVPKMYVTLVGDKLYVLAFEGEKLIVANSFRYKNISDAAYYILGVWQEVKFEQQTDEMQIAGELTRRGDLMDILRKYVQFVMPSLFPPTLLRVSREAMTQPFDLMLLSLCE